MARVTHSGVTQLHRNFSLWHNDLKGFYRFDISELANGLRNGIETPVLMLESYSSQMKTNPNKSTNFKDRDISFLLLDFAGASDDYEQRDQVLTRLEIIADDICSMLNKLNEDRTHWLYMLFDAGTFKMEKVGPVMDGMYGWNILYTLTSKSPLCYDPEKWTIPA